MRPLVDTLAVISLHTSPLAQPGSGDSGGMNVYVRELVASVSQAGVNCHVYVRRCADAGMAGNCWCVPVRCS